MNLTVNLHREPDPTTFYGRHALMADGRIGRVSPDPMGTGRPVVRFHGGRYEHVRGALTLDTRTAPLTEEIRR